MTALRKAYRQACECHVCYSMVLSIEFPRASTAAVAWAACQQKELRVHACSEAAHMLYMYRHVMKQKPHAVLQAFSDSLLRLKSVPSTASR